MNTEKVKRGHRHYYVTHKNQMRQWRREYTQKKRQTDPLFKLKENLRSRLNAVLHRYNWVKTSKLKDYIGCSIPELLSHIEKQFQPGMTWNNHGKWDAVVARWQVDHIIPLSRAKNASTLYKLCHYTNLQPLWAIDNLSKNNRVQGR